jgi:hypothetical protein
MKTRRFALPALAAEPSCSSAAPPTIPRLTQKEKDRIAREQARADQKEAQAQAKRMREATQGNQRKVPR